MVMYATKLTRRKLVVGLLAVCAMVVGAGCWLLGGEADTASTAAEVSISCKLKTNDDRVAFLRDMAGKSMKTRCPNRDVRIPDTFDAAYQSYNESAKDTGAGSDPLSGQEMPAVRLSGAQRPERRNRGSRPIWCFTGTT